MKLQKVSFSIKWYDGWIGLFVDTKKKRLYLCLLPFCLLTFQFIGKSRIVSGVVRMWRWIMCTCGKHYWVYQPGRKNHGWCGHCLKPKG